MRIQELGREIRKARLAQGLTQAQLAARAGLSRETLNLLENGLVRELGTRKVFNVLNELGLQLAVQHDPGPRRPDFVRMACITASVSFRSALSEDELIHALVSGKVPAKRSAHLITLLDEAPISLLNGLAAEAALWISPGKLEKNLARLAQQVGVSRKPSEWLKIG
jgi:transcriptional regulator with XRE-family HTH domain